MSVTCLRTRRRQTKFLDTHCVSSGQHNHLTRVEPLPRKVLLQARHVQGWRRQLVLPRRVLSSSVHAAHLHEGHVVAASHLPDAVCGGERDDVGQGE